ncbi:MAG: hypothetical protein ACXWYM_00035 [Candidatus Binatia bacterium]
MFTAILMAQLLQQIEGARPYCPFEFKPGERRKQPRNIRPTPQVVEIWA